MDLVRRYAGLEPGGDTAGDAAATNGSDVASTAAAS